MRTNSIRPDTIDRLVDTIDNLLVNPSIVFHFYFYYYIHLVVSDGFVKRSLLSIVLQFNRSMTNATQVHRHTDTQTHTNVAGLCH